MEEGLYRVKSCPGIVHRINADDDDDEDGQQLRKKSVHVELKLRVGGSRMRVHTQRYSCGALDHNSAELIPV